jgi:hypothetical protein
MSGAKAPQNTNTSTIASPGNARRERRNCRSARRTGLWIASAFIAA